MVISGITSWSSYPENNNNKSKQENGLQANLAEQIKRRRKRNRKAVRGN